MAGLARRDHAVRGVRVCPVHEGHFEKRVRARLLGEERFDLAAQDRIARARLVQKRRAGFRLRGERRLAHLLDLPPPRVRHRVPP